MRGKILALAVLNFSPFLSDDGESTEIIRPGP